MGVLAYNPVHGDYATVYPRSEPYDLAELARALPANWRRPSKPADLATAPGRNCALFAALCKLALGGSDAGYVGVLAANPTHEAYNSVWRDDAGGVGFSLDELASCTPFERTQCPGRPVPAIAVAGIVQREPAPRW